MVFLALAAPLWADPVTYHVDVDTTGLTTGSVQFQFNPSIPPPPPAGADPATATVTNFTTVGGTVGAQRPGFPFTVGDVAGALPGTGTLNNTNSFNAVETFWTFGSAFSFDVAFSGPALSNPSNGTEGILFSLFVYENDVPVGSGPGGASLGIRIFSNGTTTVAFASDGVNASVLPGDSAERPRPGRGPVCFGRGERLCPARARDPGDVWRRGRRPGRVRVGSPPTRGKGRPGFNPCLKFRKVGRPGRLAAASDCGAHQRPASRARRARVSPRPQAARRNCQQATSHSRPRASGASPGLPAAARRRTPLEGDRAGPCRG